MRLLLLPLLLSVLLLLPACSSRQDSTPPPVRRSAETGQVIEEDLSDVARREEERDRFREQVNSDLYQGRDSRF